MDVSDILQFESTADVLVVLREWIRAERRRLAALPTTLRDLPRTKVVQRVRMLAKEIGL